MNVFNRTYLILLVAPYLLGCGSEYWPVQTGSEIQWIQDGKSADEELRKLDLAKMLDPEDRRCGPEVGKEGNGELTSKGLDNKIVGKIYDIGSSNGIFDNKKKLNNQPCAVEGFNRYTNSDKYGELKQRRNRIQSAYFMVNEVACSIYTKRLYSLPANTDFSLGILTLPLIGAGMILENKTARNLSTALAGITIVVRGGSNPAYLRNKNIEALTKKISQARSKYLEKIEGKKDKDISEYSMHDALNDAKTFGELCSYRPALWEDRCDCR